MVIVEVDTKDAVRVVGSLERRKEYTQRGLRGLQTKTANLLAKQLNEVAPTNPRTSAFQDPRYKGKLKGSFVGQRSGDEAWVTTSEPQKLSLVTLGTGPHMIFPLTHITGKKALWWPGLQHPVKWVGPPFTRIHPGTDPNPFVVETFERFNFYGLAQGAAEEMADWLVRSVGPSMSEPMDFEGSNGNWVNYME